MAKSTGVGWTRAETDDAAGVARELKNDYNSLDFATPYNQQETTGLDKFGIERLQLLQDFSGNVNGIFNPSANQAHAVFSGDLRVLRTLGLTIATKILNGEVLFFQYKLNRAAGGEFTFQCPFGLADGNPPVWA